MSTLWQDIRYGFRTLARNPGFAAIAAFTLALGISGNVAIFSVFNGFHLRPLPFKEPGQLVDLDETAPRWNLEFTGLAYPDFCAWRTHNRSFEGMAAWTTSSRNFSFQGNAERIRGASVTHDLVSVLGIQPILGRSFIVDEDRPGGAKVVMLGYGLWQRLFGGRDVLGQAVQLNRESFTVVGVLPPDIAITELEGAEFWVPLAKDPQVRDGWFLRGVGRLKRGVTLSMARDDLLRMHRGLVENGKANENTFARLTPLRERMFGSERPVMSVLMGAVGVVLLIACANVAAMMLARGLARSREWGIRMSLGATPRRIAQLIGVESLLLSAFGGLLGTFLGRWVLKVFLASLADPPPRWVSFEFDWRVGLFTSVMVLLAALFGSLPVIGSARQVNLQGAVQSSAMQSTAPGGKRRSLSALVVAEVALTLILMIQATLLLQAFRSLQRVDPGFRPDHVLVYEISLPEAPYGRKEAQSAFFQSHLEQVRGLPGVTAASAVTFPPLGGQFGTFYTVENAPPKGPNEPSPPVLQRTALPGYFETMGIPIVAGRSFTEQDGRNEGSLAVIVNETFARRFWPDQDPIGKRIRNGDDKAPWLTVVGVAKDVKHYGLDQPVTPGVYLPYAQEPGAHMAVVVRSSVPPSSLVPAVRALVHRTDSELPVYGVVTMEERLWQSIWLRRTYSTLFGIFAGVALLMAIGGIYGVFSYAVSRRTQEIGVRLALGSQRREVQWLVLRQGMTLAVMGIGVGLLGAIIAVPLTRSLLYGVSPVDPLTFIAVALVLAATSVLACWLPARRAARIDPMVALRYE